MLPVRGVAETGRGLWCHVARARAEHRRSADLEKCWRPLPLVLACHNKAFFLEHALRMFPLRANCAALANTTTTACSVASTDSCDPRLI